MSGGALWYRERRALVLALVLLVGALAAVFDREWRDGEVFSPADLVFTFYPWAYDSPRAVPANPTRSDEAFYHHPLMATHFARLRAGHLPDLDPTHLSGVASFFQGLDTGRLLSPFSVPYYLLPAVDAVTLYGPLRLLVAGVCMWVLLRGLGLASEAAALGGVAYALNGHFLTWLSAPMPTVAAWLPLGVLAVHRVASAPRDAPRGTVMRWTAWLAIAVGLMALGSYPATLMACLLALGLQALVEVVWHRRWVALLWLLSGVVAGLCLGAVALGPTLGNLLSSPASARVVSADGAGWANLATWALPDFWGSPLHGNWWHPHPEANYPEHVAYFGIAVVMLAGAGVLATLRRPSAIGWSALLLLLLSVTRAYGVPPGRWLVWLPGQMQSNPFRWYAVTALALALLAAWGLQALAATPTTHPNRRRWVPLAGVAIALGLLALAVAAALGAWLPDIRARHLQAFEQAQLWRFAALACLTAALAALAALTSSARTRQIAAVLLAVVAAGDLVLANRRFNPTVERDRFYPTTPGLAWLAEEAAGARIAPVDPHAELIEGHVWGLYGIDTVTGFDFHGDRRYQALLAAAQSPDVTVSAPQTTPVWDFVGLTAPTLDLRLLGLLGVRFVVTSPVDTTPRGGGYAPAGQLLPGRRVTFTFRPSYDGLRRVDVLMATYGRTNSGSVEMRLRNERGIEIAARQVASSDLRDNDWLALTFPPAFPSAGRAFSLEISADGTTPGAAPTVWTTAEASAFEGELTIDGAPVDRALWMRAFSTAPDRVPGAELAYAGDLHAYRNPHARPAAWFVDRVRIGEPDAQLSAIQTLDFDSAHEAWLSRTPAVAAGAPARVTSVEMDDDLRRYTVEAGRGGVLVIGERAHPGWQVRIDGRPAAWQTANAVLMAVEVPAGAREIVLTFEHPLLRPSLGVTAIALAGIVFALVLTGRRPRR